MFKAIILGDIPIKVFIFNHNWDLFLKHNGNFVLIIQNPSCENHISDSFISKGADILKEN